MKIQLLGLDRNSLPDKKLLDKFQQYVKERGPVAFARDFGLDLKPGANLAVTRQMLEEKFGSKVMTLDAFLAKYAHPDDLAPYHRVAGLAELYNELYGVK